MAMQRFFEFFRRKNYGALWNNLFNFFHLRSSAMRIKFSQTYKKNNFFIWGRLFSSSSLSERNMRKLNRIPRILKINETQGFKIFCAFNNGEHRIIDFDDLFEHWKT